MGVTNSKDEAPVVEKPKRTKRNKNLERLPVVEEMFVQEVAYKCGISQKEVDNRKAEYLHQVRKNPERGLEDFTNLYKDLRKNKTGKKKQIAGQVFR